MKIHLFLLLNILVVSACNTEQRLQKFPAEKEFFPDRPDNYTAFYPRLLTADTLRNDVKAFAFTIPDSFFQQKTAWGFLYFTGLKKKKTRHSVFYLLCGFGKDSLQFLPDLNGNADFSDDNPINFKKGDWFQVALRNQYDKKAVLNYRLRYIDDNPDTINNLLYRLFSTKWKNLLPPNYIIQESSLYLRKIHLPGGQLIKLADVNHNGWYYRKWDKVFAGDTASNVSIYNNPLHSRNVRRGMHLTVSNTVYKLNKIGRRGEFVKLKKLNVPADTIDRIPVFRYNDSLGNKQTFVAEGKPKHFVIYVWGSWCIGCHTQEPYLNNLMALYEGVIPFYWLNVGDTRESMYKYLRSKNIPGRDWRIDAETASLLGADSFPNYIVVNNKGEVLYRSSNVLSLIEFLKHKI